MKITVCQLDTRDSQIDTYLSSLTEHIASEKSEFVLLPEMSFSEWLTADKNPDPDLWAQSVERHQKYIRSLNELGALAIVGTRPIINSNGSRRNEAYIWTKDSNRTIVRSCQDIYNLEKCCLMLQFAILFLSVPSVNRR